MTGQPPPACTGCGGAGGHTETSIRQVDGKTVTTTVFHTCGTCHGRGTG